MAAFDAERRAKRAERGIEVSTRAPEELQQPIAHDIELHAERVKSAGRVPPSCGGSGGSGRRAAVSAPRPAGSAGRGLTDPYADA